MKKREIIFGTMFSIIFMLLIVETIKDAAVSETFSPLFSDMALTTQNYIRIIFSVIGLSGVGVGVWGYLKANHIIDLFDRIFTIKAVIPGHYILALAPLGYGMLLIIVFGLDLWTTGLICMGIPTVTLFLFLSLRKNK